ncbi:MAG: efflux RND transporter periplasmic adaptor subunit [Bacteroidales bacterium]|jgi:membrane fusion protein (multidrug efflux system)|nr:efflux RND transporter periplasmic adaptor subunit [Bacteroidales bacterium]
MKLRPSVILIILISFIAAFLVVDRIWLEDWRAQRAEERRTLNAPTTQSAARGGSIAVDFSVLRTRNFDETISTIGFLLSNEETDLRSEASGKITEINFTEGTRVKAGTLLVKINDKDLQAQHERAIHRQKLAEDKEARQKVLLEKDAISQEEYETALTELNSLKAETDLIKAEIERTEIRAPFDGTVGLRNVSIGEYISPQITVASLINNNPIKLNFAIPEKYYGVVKNNSQVTIKISGDNRTYHAKVYAIEPKIDDATRTIQMRALAPNPDGALFPGSSCNVQFSMTPINNAIMVPSEALISEASGHKAFVYKGGVAEYRDLEIGVRTESQVQVTKGLRAGDTLIVSGILQIRPGGLVKLENEIK